MNRLEILAFLCFLKNDTERFRTDSRKPMLVWKNIMSLLRMLVTVLQVAYFS